MNLRSPSLIALGITPASPRTQRQFIASGSRQAPAKVSGAKQLPEHLSNATAAGGNGDRTGSRGGGNDVPVRVQDGGSTSASKIGGKDLPPRSPLSHEAAAEEDDHDGVAGKHGGKHRPVGLHAGLTTHFSRSGGKHRPSRSPPSRLTKSPGKSKSGHHQTGTSEAQLPSDLDSHSSCQNASSSSAQVSSDEEEAQEADSSQGGQGEWVPSPSRKADPRVNLRVRRNRNQESDSEQAVEEEQKDAHAASDEEEWTGSPVTRSRHSLKVKSGLRKSSASTNPRVLAARRAMVGNRKRSDKLSNFSGVTLKNGRCAGPVSAESHISLVLTPCACHCPCCVVSAMMA